MNYAALKRHCKEPTASTNFQGKRQVRTFDNCLFPRALHEIHDSDHLEYLEFAIRCMGAFDTIDQFYCDNYNTLLLKVSYKCRLQDLYYDIHAGFTGHFDSYGLDYFELQLQKAAFVELVVEFDKSQWYGRVNTDGFRKIIRKICSLGTNRAHIAVQVGTNLCRLEFATQAQCLGVLGNLRKVIVLITRAQQNLPKERSKVQDSFRIRHAKVSPAIPALPLFRAIEKDDSLELGKLVDNICKGDLIFSRTEFLHVLF